MSATRTSEQQKPTWIGKFFAPPVFKDDENETRNASLLNVMLLSVFAATVVGTAIIMVLEPEESLFNLIFGVIMAALLLWLRSLVRRGHSQVVSVLLSLALWATFTLLIYNGNGIRDHSLTGYFLVITVASLLLGRRGTIVFGLLSVLTMVGILYAEISGALVVVFDASAGAIELGTVLTIFVLMALLLYSAVRRLNDALERAHTSNRELQTLYATLEQRVSERTRELEERTRELEASQRVTFAASERVSPDEFLGLVVDLVRDQFDLYHVQVYIVDEEQQTAVLRESTGYAGSQLLQRRHQIPLDQTALVTQAIHTGKPVLVDDTSTDPNFMSNPLLPETRSELVVPLRIGERVFGVLDAQDRVPGRFTESTVALFRAMADQVAFLFENSDLLARVTEQTERLTIFTTQLRIAADIAAQLGTILDPEQLLQQVVELMQSRFGLYHAHIYVLEGKEGAQRLIVRAGSGEVGRVLRERGHSIPLDREKSLVARAAREREPVMVADTALESDFMPNPLLPQTRSELSVPLIAGGRVLGVLDMQDDQAGRFVESDVDTFSTLAGQIAVALQNASLFERVEASAREAQVRFEVSQALAGAQTEEQVLDCMLQQAGLYPKTQVMIFMNEMEGEELYVVARRVGSFNTQLPSMLEAGARFPASQFQMIEQAEADGLFVSDNFPLDERADPFAREMAKQMGTASMAIVPIKIGGEEIGSISVSSEEEGYIDDQKLNLYRTLAEQGATALQSARLRAQVREREIRFAGFAEATDYGFGMGELTGQLTFANPALLRILGEDKPEDAYERTFFEYYTEEDRKRLENEILPIVLESGQWVGEIPLLSSQGKLTFTEQNIFLIYDEQGQPRMVANIITDITERKQAEEEMQKLATVVMHSSELVNLATLEGQMIFLNKAGSKMLGIAPETIEQYTISHVIPEDWMPKIQGEVLPTIMNQGGWEGELQYRNVKTGECTDVYASTFMVTDPSTGAPLYLANVSRDITEQKRAEAERERFTLRLSTASDIAGQVNAILDPDELLSTVIPLLKERFGLYYVHVYVLDEETQDLRLRAGYGEPGRMMLEQGLSIPLNREVSLVARAARTREIVVVNDVTHDPNFLPNPLLPDTKSEVAVPMVVGDRVLGVFDVQHDKADYFTMADLDVFSTLAGQIAIALQNAALFEQVGQERARTQVMYEISRELNEASDEEAILKIITRTAMEAGSVVANLMYIDLNDAGEPEWLEMVAEWRLGGEPTFPMGSRFYVPDFPLSRLYIDNPDESVFIADVSTDERVDEITGNLLIQSGSRALAILPLTQAGRWVGIITFSWDKPHQFSEQEVEAYNALPTLAAPVVANRRLLVERERALTEILYHISRGLSTASDVDELLQILAYPAMDAGMSTANLLYIDLDQAGELEWAEVVAQWQREGEAPMPVETRFYLPEFSFANLWVARPNEAQLIADVAADARVDDNTENLLTQGGIRALVTIPLTQAGRWVGVIIFGWDDPHEFSEQEAEIYRALIGLASPAVAGRRLTDNLERMVSERTEQLSIASDIARQVNAILDPDQLLYEVVTQLHERLGLYHVHVYLLNEPINELLMQVAPSEVSRIMGRRELVMRAGSGEVGQALLERRHSIPLSREKSLVARAARTRKVVSVADTTIEPDFMSNPLLPETRSEVAVPLIASDQVLGVLDVQDSRPGRFTPSDLDVFGTLAGQIVTALQNAGYVEQVEARLRVSQALAGVENEEQVLDAMIQVADLYPEARISIYTIDQQVDELTIIARRDESFDSGIGSAIPSGMRLSVSQFPLGKYLSPDVPFVSSNLLLDERADPGIRELVRQMGYISAAILPITAGGEWLGVIVASSKVEGFFDERKLRPYQSLAEQGAIALYAARLHEETQRVAERLREVNQIKSEFMADMSHELRTPLNSIIGYAELMLMGISEMDPDTLEDIQAIYDNGRHLLKIINDVLDLSKIEAGRMELNIEEVAIESLLDELKTTTAGLLVNKPVEVLVEVEDDLPPIEADRVRVSQIVNNLIGNAIKFTKEGSITLRGYNADDEGWVCLEVEDTGVGMDEDDLHEIFERYRQVGEVGVRAKGTGLGLSITRHLVQMHGGVVDVRSKWGEGSAFTVRLPMKHPESEAGEG
jgi:PAS domain S-box-containing protein